MYQLVVVGNRNDDDAEFAGPLDRRPGSDFSTIMPFLLLLKLLNDPLG
jgi:hypothetical protein